MRQMPEAHSNKIPTVVKDNGCRLDKEEIKMKDERNVSLCYSLHLLKLLQGMKLITTEEYEKIAAISKEYYDTELYYV